MIRVIRDNPEEVTLAISVVEIAPDRTQFKPYSPKYDTTGLSVVVVVDADDVVEINPDGEVTVTLKGLTDIADQLATAFDKMHDKFRNRSRMLD